MADPEIAAMSTISTALEELDDDARGRVLRWAGERFGVNVGTRSAQGVSARIASKGDPLGGAGLPDAVQTYEHFAELFSAAGPKTNEDKALVAGYWFQVVQGHDRFQATDLQRELKNLGHVLPNITDALTGNIRKKPARVLQLAKSGASKQARKTYKLTHEGVIRVQTLIGGEES